MGVLEIVQCHAKLLQVVRASGPAHGLAGGLNRGQQQGDQDADNGNDHQEFDQRESPASG